VQPSRASPSLERLFAPGAFDEDAPHGFGRGTDEMSMVIPVIFWVAGQSQPGLMDQGGGLKSLARRFMGHPDLSQLAQLFINQGQQILGTPARAGIASFQGLEDARDIAHDAIVPPPVRE